MTPGDLLRRAAEVVDETAIGNRKAAAIKLLALHIIRCCGSGESAEEARLLMELLEG